MMKTNSAPDILFFNCIKKLMTNLFRAFNSLHFSQNNAPGTKFSPITFIMLHKNLRKGFLGSFYEQNLQNKAFSAQSGKRKFLMASLGLFGSLPFFQFFKAGKHKTPYIFIASLRGGHVLELDAINFRNKKMLDALDSKMLKEKKILKIRSISSKNKTSWVYVFDSQNSRKKWGNEILKQKLFSSDRLAYNNLYFSQSEGFFAAEQSSL